MFKLGLAKSIHHARVLIRQRHIRVGKQIVNIPSFMVRVDSQASRDRRLLAPPTRRRRAAAPRHALSPCLLVGRPRRVCWRSAQHACRCTVRPLPLQKHIDFALNSPFGGGRPGRVKRKSLASKGGADGGEDEE